MHKLAMLYTLPTNRDAALALDARDPLASSRDAFALEEGLIYLDGHSLGPATHKALEAVRTTSEEAWAKGLIRSWNEAGWIEWPRTVAAKLAPMIGAEPDEVIITDSVSVNLFKLAAAALPLVEKKRILVHEDEFPTDQYIAQGLSTLTACELVTVTEETLEAELRRGGVLIKSLVNYRSAAIADTAALEAIAQASGAIIVWDLSHATGAAAMNVKAAGARLATGCTYKYLNGGPGAPAFLYASRDLIRDLHSPLSGWFGHAVPFAFEADYRPLETAARFAVGTPGILSLAALDGALDAFQGIDMDVVAAKARALGDMCLWWADRLDLPSLSPGAGQPRGGHVSLQHAEGYAIVQALIARGIIPDFRAPDAMRFGFGPLYTRFIDVWDAMTALEEILATRAWDRPEFKVKAAVT